MTAARLGFEPRYSAPEAKVLPLDDLAILPAAEAGRKAVMTAWVRKRSDAVLHIMP